MVVEVFSRIKQEHSGYASDVSKVCHGRYFWQWGRTDSSDTQKGDRGEPDEPECRGVGVQSGVSTSRDDLGCGASNSREASLVVRDNATDKLVDRARREASLERGGRDVAGDVIGLGDEDGVVCESSTHHG